MTRFMNDVIVKASKTIQKSIREGKGLPDKISMKDSNSKTHNLSKKEYAGLFESRNVFILKHGRVPNYVTKNSTANNPLVMDYQDSSVTCGPTSLSMAAQMLYGNTSESAFKKACNTDSNGTSPDELVAGAKKLGYKVTKIGRNSSAVKNSLKLGKPVVAHIETGGGTKPKCLGFLNNYGHYILIYAVSGDYYLVADPTKGIKKCAFSQINKATNGRSIHYYSVSPL
ncbi:cysteine peptidase family C39 domain-containing protein [uncultured Methanobrevibacter sp.]|uniref:cysteine peptidase family C39 domain-containing protein n=1 Tax=uncultured Methanobrevibacter sp. TaxID=253161 RepID=UPI0025E88B68|nr:cysteine peptidase family C39 domain-containing protein [uncultured Methanobrevibacter sp.]